MHGPPEPEAGKISVIIPVFNEAVRIRTTLRCLQPLRKRGHEVIVVDGGSTDETWSQATPLVDHIVRSAPGRAGQMNRGASVANGKLLWFVHADTRVPESADLVLLSTTRTIATSKYWGYFSVRLSGGHFLLRIVERMMNMRSRITSIATGDQGIFVSKVLFDDVGGFSDLPLMEDIDLSKRLRTIRKPVALRETLVTSSRRWEQHGIIRTIALMWLLRLAWFSGVSAKRLARYYGS